MWEVDFSLVQDNIFVLLDFFSFYFLFLISYIFCNSLANTNIIEHFCTVQGFFGAGVVSLGLILAGGGGDMPDVALPGLPGLPSIGMPSSPLKAKTSQSSPSSVIKAPKGYSFGEEATPKKKRISLDDKKAQAQAEKEVRAAKLAEKAAKLEAERAEASEKLAEQVG